MAHNIVNLDIILMAKIGAQSHIGPVLSFRVGILAVIQVDQFDSNPIIIHRVASLPNTCARVPGPVAIFNVLGNFTIFANGVMGADLGVGVIEPFYDALQIAVSGRVDHHGGNVVGPAAPVEIG